MKAQNIDKAREYLDRLNAIRVFRMRFSAMRAGSWRKIIVNGGSADFSKIALRHVKHAIEVGEDNPKHPGNSGRRTFVTTKST